jgi:hypothetical protein
MRGGNATAISAMTDPAELDDFNATIIPFRVRGATDRAGPHFRRPCKAEPRAGDLDAPEEAVPIARIIQHQQTKMAGRLRSIHVRGRTGIPTPELTIIATAGANLTVVFLGRLQIAGTQPGDHLSVETTVASRSGGLSMINPNDESSATHPGQSDRSLSQTPVVAKAGMSDPWDGTCPVTRPGRQTIGGVEGRSR